MTEARLTRITRPLVTLGACSMIGILFLVALYDGVMGTAMAEKAGTAMRAIPDHMWYLVYISVVGYTSARSLDKFILSLNRQRPPEDPPA
jgi:hypothetical protein